MALKKKSTTPMMHLRFALGKNLGLKPRFCAKQNTLKHSKKSAYPNVEILLRSKKLVMDSH